MAATENLRRELEGIEGRIEGLREALYRAEEDLRGAGVRPGWLQALGVRSLKVDLRRRIRDLEQRRRVVRNCYTEAAKYEGWLRPAGQEERREGAVL